MKAHNTRHDTTTQQHNNTHDTTHNIHLSQPNTTPTQRNATQPPAPARRREAGPACHEPTRRKSKESHHPPTQAPASSPSPPHSKVARGMHWVCCSAGASERSSRGARRAASIAPAHPRLGPPPAHWPRRPTLPCALWPSGPVVAQRAIQWALGVLCGCPCASRFPRKGGLPTGLPPGATPPTPPGQQRAPASAKRHHPHDHLCTSPPPSGTTLFHPPR